MNDIHILMIVGSLRKDSYNLQLALEAKKYIGDRAKVEILNYNDVPLFNQDIEFPAPEAVQFVREKVKKADAVWFFTPEYNHSYPGVLKNLIDWLSRPFNHEEDQVLSGKIATYSGVGLGITGTSVAQDLLVSLLSLLNMNLMNQPRISIPNGLQLIDPNGEMNFSSASQFISNQADAFIAFIQK